MSLRLPGPALKGDAHLIHPPQGQLQISNPLATGTKANGPHTPYADTLLQFDFDMLWQSFEYLEGLDQIFWRVGLLLVILGFMAWQMNKQRSQQRSWGFRLFGIGILFAVIGANYSGFWNLIYHVLSP